MVDLVSIPTPELSDLKKSLELIKKEFPVYLEFQEYQAKLLKVKYEALMEEGFSSSQALELCKEL